MDGRMDGDGWMDGRMDGDEWMDGDEVRRRLPMMHLPDALAATCYEKDGLADPNSVVMAYVQAGMKLGVKALTSSPVVEIKQLGGRVTGVVTPHGLIETSKVVNAAGPWAKQIGDMAHIDTPIRRDPHRLRFAPGAAPSPAWPSPWRRSSASSPRWRAPGSTGTTTSTSWTIVISGASAPPTSSGCSPPFTRGTTSP